MSAHPVSHVIPEGAPRSGVIHIRYRHTERFTVVGNHLAQHEGLSAAAIGLAVYIQSLPDGVSVTAKALALRFREGERTVRRALNELESAGYLARPRLPVGGGKFATRTLSYDKPGGVPGPGSDRDPGEPQPEAGPVPRPLRQRPVAPRPEPTGHATPSGAAAPATCAAPATPVGPAADLLARLRLADPRLMLSARDVHHLAPAVDTWLARAVAPDQITHTLTVNLPPERVPIHHPVRFLEYRLTAHLPPPLPAEGPSPPRSAPLITCDGCERAFRSHDPDEHCTDCREAADRPAA
ncbi:helix-turn-helix domain-containing protein [Streptomyces sp. NPDC046316]|uniref:helix-turn-helix domain-containing protein n=1 Tax=Streptomyces sp. NPDC046316 TaxID=3154494 RepID=UPI0033FA3CE1